MANAKEDVKKPDVKKPGATRAGTTEKRGKYTIRHN